MTRRKKFQLQKYSNGVDSVPSQSFIRDFSLNLPFACKHVPAPKAGMRS